MTQQSTQNLSENRYGLPWSGERGERRRLLSIALVVVPLFVVFAGYVNWIELPEKDRQEREALPPQLLPKPEVKESPKPEAVAKAREKAKNTGILAMGSELAKLNTLASSIKLDAPVTRTAEPIARKT